jgi:hypothetical protein
MPQRFVVTASAQNIRLTLGRRQFQGIVQDLIQAFKTVRRGCRFQ